jgi:hypothetical protein
MGLPSMDEVLSTLEISPKEIEEIASSHRPDWESANNAFKILVKSKRKKLAREIHPDKGGDIEKMKAVNQYADLLIRNVRLGPRPQPRPQFIRVVVTNINTGTGTATGGFYF